MYRRVLLVLQFLLYLMEGGPALPKLALAASLQLARDKKHSWISDILHTLSGLPVPETFSYANPRRFNSAYVRRVMEAVTSPLYTHLAADIVKSGRLPLLPHRFEINADGESVQAVLRFCDHLRVPDHAHRRAVHGSSAPNTHRGLSRADGQDLFDGMHLMHDGY